MNKIIIIALAICWPVIIHAQDKKAVNNNLKTIKTYEQKWEKGTAGKVNMESMVTYDQKGNVIEEIEYKEGKINKHFTYKYDEKNNKTQETELDPSGKKIRITVYVYDKNLKTEKTVYDGSNHILSKKTYKYETY
jgi:hypothetical protein